MKAKSILIMLILAVVILPIISADSIQPGYHSVSFNNYITNLEDFPDYTFISYGYIGSGVCPILVIEADGKIPDYYKFCELSVYAIPKDKFNASYIENANADHNATYDDTYIRNYFDSIGAKEVVKNVKVIKTVSDANPTKEITNYYSIDLSKTLQEPDKVEVKQNNLIYFYIIIPIIALMIILTIFILRKRRK